MPLTMLMRSKPTVLRPSFRPVYTRMVTAFTDSCLNGGIFCGQWVAEDGG